MLARPEPGEGKNKCLIVRVSREHCERRIENSLTPEVENMRRSDAGKHNDNNAINALNDPNGLVSSTNSAQTFGLPVEFSVPKNEGYQASRI
jgi:hypothetical protein